MLQFVGFHRVLLYRIADGIDQRIRTLKESVLRRIAKININKIDPFNLISRMKRMKLKEEEEEVEKRNETTNDTQACFTEITAAKH